MAFFTAVTSVDRTGLPDAAVATGTFAIASKLPGLAGSVGTAAQPEPNWAEAIDGDDEAIGALADILGAALLPAAVVSVSPSPQADRASSAIAPTVANIRRDIRAP
ncbi:hypothetical protein Nm8I071_36060 [Nonomuraea sp. TT08I-71]|nr:hypothetical protein Nm8I071_36060 [Nonomuraea sp. TT08I-71]